MQLFVTTYKIGNSMGFGVGKWFDLSDYADKSDFMDACNEYAKTDLNDNDPEICFPDFDCMPSVLYSEYDISEKAWDFMELSQDEQEIIANYMYLHNVDLATALNEALEKFVGVFDNLEQFGREMAELSFDLPKEVAFYFDYERYANDLMCDFYTHNKHYFYA